MGHSAGLNSIAFSADGKRVVSGSDDNLVKIWDADTGAEVCNPGECTRWCEEVKIFLRWLHLCGGVDLVWILRILLHYSRA